MGNEWSRKIASEAVLAISFLVAIEGRVAMAQTASPVTLPNPLGVSSFSGVVSQITSFLFVVAVPLTAIMALIGGFQMITSSGNPEKFNKGRQTLMYAAIGFAVVILAGGIVGIVQSIL